MDDEAGEMGKAEYQPVIRLLASITAEDDRAIAEFRSSGKVIDGTDYANTYVFALRLREGRIARVAEHFNALIAQDKMKPAVRAVMAKRERESR